MAYDSKKIRLLNNVDIKDNPPPLKEALKATKWTYWAGGAEFNPLPPQIKRKPLTNGRSGELTQLSK